ncbi:MAG: hypothetical protein Q7S39_08660, partial [Ignavibacteria bacterium]|nr:hypothetical protein [Ignavibacteria bacterium]
MKSLLQIRSLILFVLLSFFILTDNLISQDKSSVGTKLLNKEGKVAFQTIPQENTSDIESLDNHLNGLAPKDGEQYVLGGTVLWYTQDPIAIANTVALNGIGDKALTAWTLNSMRVSLYSDANNIPLWEFSTLPYDAHIDVSDNSPFVAVAAGPNFYLYDTSGAQIYNLTLPDSLYASVAGISRDGSLAVFLANAFGNSNTARVYFIQPIPPTLPKSIDVPVSEIGNWTGVNFSADGSKIVINGRNHIYVYNSLDGSLIWDRFLDNTEAPAVISGNGNVVVTADNSGFVQTWIFDEVNSEYGLLWQYRIPVGQFTNWASSVDISADGSTIIA